MKIGIITCGLFLSVLSTSAFARSAECSRSPHNRTFDNAKEDRIRELTRTWENNYRGDCGNQVNFEAAVSRFVSEEGPAIRRCKNEGYNEGTMQVLNRVSRQCSHEGHQAGAEDGRNFGREYCATGESSTFLFEGDFEISFEETCRDVFIRYADRRCPDKKDGDRHFFQTVADKCEL